MTIQRHVVESRLSTSNNAIRETAWHTALTIVSTLAIQVTTFAILAVAALIMPTEAFAKLSLIVAAAMLANAVFDLGMNTTSTKMYGDTKDEGYLRTAFAVRLSCLPISALSAGVATYLAGAPNIGLGIALGAVLNLWYGMRASDQARQDYRSFMRTSIAFAIVRVIAGGGTLYLTSDPFLTAAATFGVPALAGLWSTSARFAFEAFSSHRRPAGEMISYATYVYINAAVFIAIPYVPQFIIASRLDATATGTYGLILVFSGPVALLVNSIYNVALPKMLGGNDDLENTLWSAGGAALLTGLWGCLMAGGGVLALLLGYFYAAQFPGVDTVFLMFFAGFSASALAGIYSVSMHTQGVPHVNMIVSVVRFICLLLVLYLFGTSLVSIVLLTLAVLMAGQIAVIVYLWRRRRYSLSSNQQIKTG